MATRRPGYAAYAQHAGASVPISGAAHDYPSLVTNALNRLRDAGVGGPFAIALSERCYAELTEATEGGYPVLQHVRRLIDGPLVWAPGLDGAVVLSMRGEDFELTVGQDFSIGYLDHNAERVRFTSRRASRSGCCRRRLPCRWCSRRLRWRLIVYVPALSALLPSSSVPSAVTMTL